jgi:uncharacterized protein YciI
MFLFMVNYKKSIEDVEKYLNDHKEFLSKYYSLKKFVLSGRRDPRVGGFIIANIDTVEEARGVAKEDPFVIHGIAEYEIIKIIPTQWDPNFIIMKDKM